MLSNSSEKFKFEKEISREKEPKLKKVVLFVRHPSVVWIDRVLEEAELHGQDIETYAPIDREGLGMVRRLSEYLQEDLSTRLPGLVKEESLEGKFRLISSPIKRAQNEAAIILSNLNLAHLDNRQIPYSANKELIKDEAFGEVSWIKSKKEAIDLVAEARERGVHPVKLWFEKIGPEETIKRLNAKIPEIEKALNGLRQEKTPLDIIFSHRLAITLALWVIEQKEAGRKDLNITQGDLPEIIDLCGKIAYTSITEVWITGEGSWQIKSVGKTPHLDRDPTFKGPRGIFD